MSQIDKNSPFLCRKQVKGMENFLLNFAALCAIAGMILSMGILWVKIERELHLLNGKIDGKVNNSVELRTFSEIGTDIVCKTGRENGALLYGHK